MQISENQMQQLARAMFTRKLAGAMGRAVPEFAHLSTESRAEFLDACQGAATARGLLTELGIIGAMRYAYCTLRLLLDSGVPEVRKVHAMNEWVHVLLGEPGNLAAADEALKSAFYRTGAWGAPAGGR